MKLFQIPVSNLVSGFLRENLTRFTKLEKANQILLAHSGIGNFMEDHEELNACTSELSNDACPAEEPDRQEYGDFQTNIELAGRIMGYLETKPAIPDIVVEPTCGKGAFILAALKKFPGIKQIYGVEIYKPYIWEAKFAILDFFLQNPVERKPGIHLCHGSVFEFDFDRISAKHPSGNLLITGNPPWVTNSMLGSLHSTNLPKKSNFKNHGGLDAMTGKGNFDIAENITLTMLDAFRGNKGHLAFLLKNSVVKNLVFDQYKNRLPISSLERHGIDSKKEFGVSVGASMFYCQLNAEPGLTCSGIDFYDNRLPFRKFGWMDDRFVANIENYANAKKIEGICSYTWRQGVKHDCSTVMELEKVNDQYVNGSGENTLLEDGLVYGILKSSDLRNTLSGTPRKYTIITQRKPGQDTGYIKSAFPKTYDYLFRHRHAFAIRKSAIYKGKPPFAIFGIGDYSFKPFKVAISGLYKTFHFTLILPHSGKPVMLDDTCYFLGFDNLEFAVYTSILLNWNATKEFLGSITFPDAKRIFTKDILMRIDLKKLAGLIPIRELESGLSALNEKYGLNAGLGNWKDFTAAFSPVPSPLLSQHAGETSP